MTDMGIGSKKSIFESVSYLYQRTVFVLKSGVVPVVGCKYFRNTANTFFNGFVVCSNHVIINGVSVRNGIPVKGKA